MPVRLRPPTPDDGPFLARMASDVAGEFNHVGVEPDPIGAAGVGAGRMIVELAHRGRGYGSGAQFRAGGWHDLVLYGLLRSDP